MRMTMGNPSVRRLVRKAQNGQLTEGGAAASYKGVYLKTALYVCLTIIAAVATELSIFYAIANGYIAQALTALGIATGVCFIPLIAIVLIITFVPSTVKVLGCIYAILQGGLLGLVASMIDVVMPGVAFAAFCATAVVFIVSLIVNRFAKLRISSDFVRGLTTVFISLLAVQLVMFALSLFGVFNYTAYIWVQLAVSAVCVVWATLMLFWDLNNADMLVQFGADKKYEWNVAFSLTTTLIYLYVEILEIIVRLVALFGRNN